jgi:hypothetical protein
MLPRGRLIALSIFSDRSPAMKSNNRDRRWAGGVGMAVSAAFAAAMIGLANAPAAGADADLGPFEDLFGVHGINSWTPSADSFLLSSDPTLAASLDTSVDNFLVDAGVFVNNPFPEGDDPFSFLVSSLDPSAFSAGADGDLLPLVDGSLPLNATADFAVGLDYALFATGIGGNDVAISDLLSSIMSIPGEIEGLGFLLALIFS